MSSNNDNAQSEQAKTELIVTELFAKCVHIILESRTLCVSSRNVSGDQALSSTSVRPGDKWFNLALRECPAALESIGLWRQSKLGPMIVDVVLVQRPIDSGPMSFSPKKGLVRHLSLEERCSNGRSSDRDWDEAKSEKIIERWVVKYESGKDKECSSNRKRRSGNNNILHTLYKKSILLLRSLYATVRILPAYKIFRDLNMSSQVQSFTLAHRVFSFVEPFTRGEEAGMQCFRFNPVDTSRGRLCLSVMYRASVLDVISEPLSPMPPELIQDYVGGPSADPLKRFLSLPESRDLEMHHSWCFDQYRLSPPEVAKPATSQTDRTVHKSTSIGKDKAKKFSGLKTPSNDSQQISLSRSSSRSFPNDIDEPDFACAFDVEYDTVDPGSRPESFGQKGQIIKPLEPGGFFPIRKSQDAAVGALVHMLKKAPPLRQGISSSIYMSENAMPMQEPNKINNAGKTTADALEELKSYRDMKNMLLQQGDDKSPS